MHWYRSQQYSRIAVEIILGYNDNREREEWIRKWKGHVILFYDAHALQYLTSIHTSLDGTCSKVEISKMYKSLIGKPLFQGMLMIQTDNTAIEAPHPNIN
jgi:hypothetical protein